MRQQYISMKRPYAEEVFNGWFEHNVLQRVIDVIELKGAGSLYKELTGLGLPKSEHIYFRVAVTGQASLLVSLDSDFFDPKQKAPGAKEKVAILMAGNGPVCRHMKKGYEVTVCCPQVFASVAT